MKVFVSSTYQDLLDYRAAATRSILMAGDLSDDMLFWPGSDSPPLEVSLRHVRSSDLVILVLAHRYGTCPAGHDKSITELEFDEAIDHGIPVLAFRIDPEYPWPPRYIETDQKSREQLNSFLAKVGGKVTVARFSTPDSLEVAIAHALAHFGTRPTSVLVPGFAQHRLRRLNRSESLHYSPDSIVKIGHAPDGALLLLSVKRQIPVAQSIKDIANALGRDIKDPILSDILSRLNQEALDHATATGVERASWEGNPVEVYVPHQTLINYMAPSLLQSMVGTSPGTPVESSSPGGSAPGWEGTITSGHVARPSKADDVASLGGNNRFFCVGLDADQRVWSGGWTNSRPSSVVLLRPFIEEGLERLPGVRYIIRKSAVYHDAYRGSEITLLDTNQRQAYIKFWVELLTSSSDEELTRLSCEMLVPYSSIVDFILEIVDEAAGLHSRGKIHGDIKPSNILVSRGGNSLIDEVGISDGDISPTVSVGWSPYEQLLRQPLSYAADVFSLGRLLLCAVGGEELGKVMSYRMPGGRISTIIEDPAVYIAESGSILSGAVRGQWSRFIETALKTDPRRRWPTAEAMGRELRALIGQGGINGYARISFPWGTCPSLIEEGNGNITIGWVMDDHQLVRLW